MDTLALELDQTLSQLDAPAALALKRLVRDALALAQASTTRPPQARPPAATWPDGYFATLPGCLADDDWEAPADAPLENITE